MECRVTSRLSFGIQTLPNQPWAAMTQRWREIEGMGFDSIWLPDHFFGTFRPELPFFESWTLLAGLATVTERVRIGVLVSSNTFRHPALLAKETATVDHISGGRLEVGLGTGWVEIEHRLFGIPYPDAPERVARFNEAVEVVDLLLRQEITTYDGRFYQLREAPSRPAPVQQPRPPLTLAAHSPRMLKIIAPYADRWNSMGTPDELRERGERLDAACLAIGRDPAAITRSLLYVPSIMPDEHPWDSIDAFHDFVGRFREAGISDFILQPPPPERWEIIEEVGRGLKG
jgi:alkanesulfonate monooxygenase SsuD/methylene tetrahydromethanopterin reductase-like flavin-dependent oxidoreductase (luciferase family)